VKLNGDPMPDAKEPNMEGKLLSTSRRPKLVVYDFVHLNGDKLAHVILRVNYFFEAFLQ